MEIYEHFTDDFFEIERAEHDKYFTMPKLHYHNAYEIMILEKGHRELIYENKIYNISEHDVIMIKPNLIHRNTGGSAFARTVIYFTEEYLDTYFTQSAKNQLTECFSKECVSLNDEEFVQLMRNSKKIMSKYKKDDNYIFVFLSEILSILNNAEQYDNEQKRCGKNLMLVNVMKYVDKNAQSIENISEIADHLHITKQYLCRLVKNGTGLTVTQYINSVRIRRACELLTNTKKQITDICYECGFNSSMYFCKTFKRIMKMTPTEYKEQHF